MAGVEPSSEAVRPGREELEGKREGVVFHRVKDGDHSFQTPSSKSPIEGMETQFKQTLDWFLK
jgi:hypothetical protein